MIHRFFCFCYFKKSYFMCHWVISNMKTSLCPTCGSHQISYSNDKWLFIKLKIRSSSKTWDIFSSCLLLISGRRSTILTVFCGLPQSLLENDMTLWLRSTPQSFLVHSTWSTSPSIQCQITTVAGTHTPLKEPMIYQSILLHFFIWSPKSCPFSVPQFYYKHNTENHIILLWKSNMQDRWTTITAAQGNQYYWVH